MIDIVINDTNDRTRNEVGNELTNSSQKSRNRLAIGVTSRLILSQDIRTHTLDNTNLSRLLIIHLAQRERESAKLLDNLRQSLARRRTLEAIGDGRATVQGGAERQALDLTAAQGHAELNAPDFTDFGVTFALDAAAGSEDELLLAFDLVALEEPGGGALDEIAVIGLDDLFEESIDLGVRDRLLGLSLLLLFVGAGGEETCGDEKAQQQLVGVVSREEKVGGAAGDLLALAGGDDDGVADDGAEAVDLSTELDLHDLAGLQGDSSLFRLGDERSVGRDIGAGRDGRGVSEACNPS